MSTPKLLAAAIVGGTAFVTLIVTMLAQADTLGRQHHHVAAFALGGFAVGLLISGLAVAFARVAP